MASVICLKCRADLLVFAHEYGCEATRRATDEGLIRLLEKVRKG